MPRANIKPVERKPLLANEIFGFRNNGEDINIPLSSIRNLIVDSLSGVTNEFVLLETLDVDSSFISNSLNLDEVTTLTFNNENIQGNNFELLKKNKDNIYLKVTQLGFEISAVFIVSSISFTEDETTVFEVAPLGDIKIGSLHLGQSYFLDLGISGSSNGDQDISGIATNATDITNLETEQVTQNTAIALNTAKVSNVDETLTSLAIASNILTYTDEDGTETDLDLSLYLDDTNLARLTSGVLDGTTGIATFTRDDGTSFTLDLSSIASNTIFKDEDGVTKYESANDKRTGYYDVANETYYPDIKAYATLANNGSTIPDSFFKFTPKDASYYNSSSGGIGSAYYSFKFPNVPKNSFSFELDIQGAFNGGSFDNSTDFCRVKVSIGKVSLSSNISIWENASVEFVGSPSSDVEFEFALADDSSGNLIIAFNKKNSVGTSPMNFRLNNLLLNNVSNGGNEPLDFYTGWEGFTFNDYYGFADFRIRETFDLNASQYDTIFKDEDGVTKYQSNEDKRTGYYDVANETYYPDIKGYTVHTGGLITGNGLVQSATPYENAAFNLTPKDAYYTNTQSGGSGLAYYGFKFPEVPVGSFSFELEVKGFFFPPVWDFFRVKVTVQQAVFSGQSYWSDAKVEFIDEFTEDFEIEISLGDDSSGNLLIALKDPSNFGASYTDIKINNFSLYSSSDDPLDFYSGWEGFKFNNIYGFTGLDLRETFTLKKSDHEANTINSIVAGEISGSDVVLNVVSLTQAEYDAGTKIATTLYIIKE